MDESRPGHPTRLPLIIERPDLAHPARRAIGVALTLLCWAIWLGMWVVLLGTFGYRAGFEVPRFLTQPVISLASVWSLIHLVPYAIAAAAALLLAAYVRERLKRLGNKPDTRWRPVGMDRLARDAALDPDNLARWQQAQVLYVEHGPQGRVKSAYTSRPD